jgi:hypothetical protein
MSSQFPPSEHTIGTLNEKSLHAALKEWYAQPGDQFEVRVAGFIVDIVRGDLLIEIQTSNFASIKGKLAALTAQQPVRLVYPVARDKWIIKLAEEGVGHQSRRRSPRRGTVEDLFAELVSIPHLLAHPNFSLDVLLVQEEEVRRYDATRRWRRWRRGGWVTHERRLLQVVDRHLFQTPADAARLLPAALADPFTTSELATALARPRRLAQQMAYCLREMGGLEVVGKQSNALLYSRTAL